MVSVERVHSKISRLTDPVLREFGETQLLARLSPATVLKRLGTCERFGEYLFGRGVQLCTTGRAQWDHSDLLRWSAGVASATLKTRAGSIRALTAWGIARRLPFWNGIDPMVGMPRVHVLTRRRHKLIPREVVQGIIDYPSLPRNRLFLAASYLMGIRPGELVQLRLSDVLTPPDHTLMRLNWTIRGEVSKTRVAREVSAPPNVLGFLRDYLTSDLPVTSGEQFLYPGRTEGHLSVKRLEEIHVDTVLGSKSGTPQFLYVARHDCIARHCSSEPPQDVTLMEHVSWLAKQMGNSPAVLLDHYLYYSPDRKKELELLAPVTFSVDDVAQEADDE